MKKVLSLLIIATVAITFSFSVAMIDGSVNAAAKSKKYDLPVKVTAYTVNHEGKLVKGYYYKLSYNKYGDVKKFKSDLEATTTIKWTYKKGKPKKAVAKSKYAKITANFDKKGRIKNMSTKEYGDGVDHKRSFTYNKKGHVIKEKMTSKYGTKITKYSIKYHKNGIPKKIKATGTEWDSYNKKGLMTRYHDINIKYKYDKKGRITQMLGYQKNENGNNVLSTKIVYKYGKAKTKDRMKYLGTMSRFTWGTAWSMDAVCSGVLYPDHVTLN